MFDLSGAQQGGLSPDSDVMQALLPQIVHIEVGQIERKVPGMPCSL